MKRRKFLLAGGAWLVSQACGGLSRLAPPGPTLAPTLTLVQISTAAPVPTAASTSTVEPTQAVLEASPSPTDIPFELPVVDDFASPSGRANIMVAADSAGQVGYSNDGLVISDVAPGPHDPWIYDRRAVPLKDGQVVGGRFKAGWARATGWMGLASKDGQMLAGVRRTAAENEGGVFAYGERWFPVLNLYSDCWYDFVIFQQAGGAAFAVNDGAGLELVLIAGEEDAPPAEAERAASAYLGYRAEGGEKQGASIAGWYALGTAAFPPVLVEQAEAAADFQADLNTNAAWVETRIERAGGSAGLRFRSLDGENEYRVYFDETGLKVDRVFEGKAAPVARQAMAPAGEAKLAVRYNELTLTVYYNGAPTEIVNRKIGAPALLPGSKIGIYSTDPGNIFRALAARPVNFAIPEDLRGQLMNSRQVLCLGDSLTSADNAYGYQNRLRKQLGGGWVTVDCGVSGQTTYQMLMRLEVHLRRYQPGVVIVLGGTNDIALKASAETIQNNLQKIYSTAKQAGAQVIAITLPPRGNSGGWTEEKQAVLEAVNDWIRGAGNVDRLVDAYELLKDPDEDVLQGRYDGGDGLHLSPQGYSALADEIYSSAAW